MPPALALDVPYALRFAAPRARGRLRDRVDALDSQARDQGLLRRWRDGDQDAGLELLHHYRPLFVRVCARFGTRERQEVLEIWHELVLRMLERLSELPERVHTSFAGFLAWQTRDVLQRVREREGRAPRTNDELPEPSAHDPEPGTWEAIERCADKLPPREREVFEHRYLLELSLEETATRVGSNANAVGQSVFRLVRKMRECLKAHGYDLQER